ncbi:MAG: ABC-F family ATP-binding cassette domain-containing protein [Chthoniobacteraceae bacterium]
MLTVSQVSKSFGGRTLFQDASLLVRPGERLGLVGPNGAGKSTLFSLILGEDTPDAGSIRTERGVSIGFLPQESKPFDDETVLQIATAHASEDDAWEVEPKAKRILAGLAFREADYAKPARTLSGGWVMRAHLARLLVQEPDLLLLDEPTNHLDLESLQWFQRHLCNYRGAILVISHDREFLNQLVNSVVEICRSRLVRYVGNYDDFVREKIARDEQHAAAYANQQREIAHLQDFVNRFRAKASKATQAQSKLKQIERMERIEAPLAAEKGVAKFSFPQPQRSGSRVITLKDVRHAYDALVVYESLNFEAERGQRTVLVGPNGAGKSTLLKLLGGVLPVQRGERDPGHNVKVGYFAQYRIEQLHPRHTVLQSALDSPNPVGEQTARTVLGSFLFRGDDVFKPVSVLSGGEKSRLALVKLLLDPPNLLLMDEPTTHLDIGSIDSLIGALQQYEGTLVFISHDVHFIRAIAKTVLHINAGVLTPYAGDYDYYLEKSGATNARVALTSEGRLTNAQPAEVAVRTAGTRAPGLREQKESRKAIERAERERRKKIEHLEMRIAHLEGRQREIATELEKPEVYAPGGPVMELNRELTVVTEDLERTTAEWEKLGAQSEETPA